MAIWVYQKALHIITMCIMHYGCFLSKMLLNSLTADNVTNIKEVPAINPIALDEEMQNNTVV